MKNNFSIRVETHKESGRFIAAYLQVRKGRSARTVELAGGDVLADYNCRGRLLGIEVLSLTLPAKQE